MKTIIKLEEGFMFLLSIYLFSLTDFRWYWFPVLALAPDIGMIGYVFNTRVGAITYNLFHHKGLAIAIYLTGISSGFPTIQLAGIILFGHASMDRLFGYGLKYPDSFKRTHLGSLDR